MTTRIVELPPDPENIALAVDGSRTDRFWIDTYSRPYRAWRYAVLYYDPDGKPYVRQGGKDREVIGVRVLRVDGKTTYCFGLMLDPQTIG